MLFCRIEVFISIESEIKRFIASAKKHTINDEVLFNQESQVLLIDLWRNSPDRVQLKRLCLYISISYSCVCVIFGET